MTVCIAAISDGAFIVGASDRLLTAGDVQFQPDMPKIRQLTNSIVAMTAGDAWLQSEALAGTSADVTAAIHANPNEWVPVRYAADRYCHHWAEIKLRRSEHNILKPLGLTSASFLSSQGSMNDKVVQDITSALVGFTLPQSACLVAGVDTTGPHIYVIHDGIPMQADTVGFAAIGIGARHAEAQLQAAQYAPNIALAASVSLVHLAKTRAEVAPGVGENTDMFMIGAAPGSYTALRMEILDYLRDQVRKMRNDEATALVQAQQRLAQFVASQGTGPPDTQEAEPDGEGPSAPERP